MHPMYTTPAGSSLRQGDVLEAESVRSVLRGHLDYFAEKPYFVGFCVLTQTCDLQRDRRVHFMTLAVIREITDAFARHVPENKKTASTLLRSIISHKPHACHKPHHK